MERRICSRWQIREPQTAGLLAVSCVAWLDSRVVTVKASRHMSESLTRAPRLVCARQDSAAELRQPMTGLGAGIDDKGEVASMLLEEELRRATFKVASKGLVGEADASRLIEDRRDPNRKLGTNAEADGRKHGALHDDVSNAHCSALAEPLRLGAQEVAREDVVVEEERSVAKAQWCWRSQRHSAGLLR